MRIFLASSNELEHERVYLAGCVLYLNRLLREAGGDNWVELVKWEFLDPSMSLEHKQKMYNRELMACDAAVVLFWRKIGEYTESEFLTALRGVRAGTSPRRLTVLFKETDGEMLPELAAWRAKLGGEESVETGTFSSDGELRTLFLGIVFVALRDAHPAFAPPPDAMLAQYGLK